jgi:curved DNA-binding protein
MDYKDYYKILHIGKEVSQDEIKRAYRKLARKFHPDVNKSPDAEARFKEINEAYEVLKDEEKRKAYDTFGSNWREGQDFRPPPDWEGRFRRSSRGPGASSEQFSDFFESLFGGGRGQHSQEDFFLSARKGTAGGMTCMPRSPFPLKTVITEPSAPSL